MKLLYLMCICIYFYISIPSLQMTGTTPVRRRKENRQEKMMMKDEGGNADGDECWSR